MAKNRPKRGFVNNKEDTGVGRLLYKVTGHVNVHYLFMQNIYAKPRAKSGLVRQK